MRLLVTRPPMDAAPLAEQLAAMGHDVVLSPLIDIELEAGDADHIHSVLTAPAAFGGLAFTSANGVRALMAHLTHIIKTAQKEDAPQLENIKHKDLIAAWQQLPAFAVGPQTAAILRAAQFQNIHQADGDLPALVKTIAAHYEGGAPLLHSAGRDRAGDLAGLLESQNINCARAVLYRAQAAKAFSAAAQAALEDTTAPIDAVVLYSQRSADIFCALYAKLSAELNAAGATGANVVRPKAYCLSPSIETAMRAAGFEAVAPLQADSDALLDLLAL
ncbi:MAG: uroporphyrinogen-III synthase [Alphaproteobacteria bacterium]|nr:uroporphyrinogen-III synthase [Alphaproteobacteria bacterium]